MVGALRYAHTYALTRAYTRIRVHARTLRHTHTRVCTHPQIKCKQYALGHYAMEVDAAAARDVVAKVLGSRLNFTTPRKITGQRSEGADQAVADAVKAANTFVLGNSMMFGLLVNTSPKS